MIFLVIGTTAEAIKVAPLAKRLEKEGIRTNTILTMQHGQKLIDSVRKLGFPGPYSVIPNGSDGASLRSFFSVMKWLFSLLWWFTKNYKKLKSDSSENSIVIVHGDTLTTVMGTIFAKLLSLPSAHIEAGLRSGDWRNPFPEELDRKIAGLFATIHYVPTEEAAENLKNRKNVVFTHGNTVIDAVNDARPTAKVTKSDFGICLLHRYEFLSQPVQIRQTLNSIASLSPLPVNLYVDDFSGRALSEFLTEDIRQKINVQQKLDYVEFINTLRESSFVITDSGGIQAECAELGIPTLIHRKATEQFEGVGQNILLSMWEQKTLEEFLVGYESFKRKPTKRDYSPTQIIIEDLRSRGFLQDKFSNA